MRAFVLLTLIAAGCGTKSTCVPGQSAYCNCSDGSSGAQLCKSDGTFAACDCSGRVSTGGGTGGNGSGADMAMGGGDMSTAPAGIYNATARITAEQKCGSPLVDCATYDITFLWSTDLPVNRIEQIKVTVGGTTFVNVDGCGQSPWTSTSATTVGPLDLTFMMAGYNSAFAPSMYVPCGSTSSYRTDVTGAQTPAQTSGALHLEVTGILADASPFTAGADVPLR